MESWQPELLNKLVSHLQQDEDVLGLALFGSGGSPEPGFDDWSDIDLLLVVRDHSLERFFPTLAWLQPIGTLYTYSQSSERLRYITRVCFDNMERVDFVITTESQFTEIDQWQRIPFRSGVKILFSRTKNVDNLATRAWPKSALPPTPEGAFQQIVRDFRFKGMLAVYKVVRDDLLIALHLTQDLVRDCCLLGMMLRDRATGTNVHKSGGIGNQSVQALQAVQQPFTPLGLLESIQACQVAFENLACQWSSAYIPNRQPLLDWIEKAKNEVASRN